MSKEMVFSRPLLADLLDFLKRHPSVIQVLVGPRQVGKTTLAHHLIDAAGMAAVYASADAPLPPGPEWIDAHWRQAELRAASVSGPVLLVLDEVQKVRGWSEAVKRHWDSRDGGMRSVRLLILGSSSLLLQAGLSESMSGRFFLHR